MKRCGKCKAAKAESEFGKDAARDDGLQPYCKPCRCKLSRRAYYANPEKAHRDNLRARYGITREQYDVMLQTQGGKCAICRRAERARGPNGPSRRLAVDHCHTTGRVRGLLCQGCNLGLGGFEDSEASLLAASAYLKRGA